MGDQLTLKGTLEGHSNWVTALATYQGVVHNEQRNVNRLLSASRDKSIIVWEITEEEGNYGYAVRSLRGHNHFVSDVALARSGDHALSGSWDGTLRLWNIENGKCITQFKGHTKDVLSVAFSPDNRQIVSGSRDRTVKVWNIIGDCKYTIQDNGHTEWVSCVRFSPNPATPLIVSAGWDKLVKVWSFHKVIELRTNLKGHTGNLNTVTVAPDGSLCASGGKDGTVMLWDLTEGKQLYSLSADDVIHSLVFSPNRYWLVGATESSIRIWDLESKGNVDKLELDVVPTGKNAKIPYCTSLAWSSDGSLLFAGYTDNKIRIYKVNSNV